ncbi:MAG: HigA family addiction module antitoxin [bacterium]|nr:HigA family addiction module antitoxin [bacterium]
MALHDPPHPGQILRYDCLDPLGLTVARAAAGLGVSKDALSGVLDGSSRVSVDMAFRLAEAFGSTPETWLGMQMAYDLWQARHDGRRLEVESFVRPLAV